MIMGGSELTATLQNMVRVISMISACHINFVFYGVQGLESL